ncbi:MAG: sugar phosphate isomerase/epimerase family protein [Candidatus Bathyarchaeia archaeon]
MKISRREFIAGLVAAGASVPIAGIAKSVGKRQVDNGKICIFSKHLQWLDYQGMAETAAQIGFDGVDLTVRPRGHVLPERAEDDLPKAVEAVNKAGLKVYMITTAIRDPNDVHTDRILRTASQLGIKYYRLGYLKYDDSLGIERSLEAHKATLSELGKLNKLYRIHGAYQNHAGTGVGGPVWDIWYLIKDLNPKWIGCQYDIKHATHEGGRSWPLGLKLLKKYIKITAIKDFKWVKEDGKWRGQHVPLSEGMVDFVAYFKLAKQLDISGPISMHFEYPLGGADKGKSKLSIDGTKVLGAMRNDLKILRGWVHEFLL